MSSGRGPGRLAALCLAAGVLLAGCAGAGGAQTEAETTPTREAAAGSDYPHGMVGEQQPSGEPVDGGTLDIAVLAQPSGLDPARSRGLSGVYGGMGLAAIYGVLMRYDPQTKEYVPQLAKGLTHNADYTTWRLTLRPNVSFSDGTPLDAQAVQFSINRYIELGGELAPLMQRLGLEVRTPNPLTVVFELAKPWPNFPYILAESPGCIVSPAAVRKWGDDFDIHPVGAGPFELERLAAGQEIVLSANEDYWGGRPHLDKLRFVLIRKPQARLGTLGNGGVDAAFFNQPDVVTAALEQGYSGYVSTPNLGRIMYINNREGRPGSDVRVRKAIAYAINPELIARRVYEGAGLPGKALFQKNSRWHTDAEPNPYNPDKARKLLNQAMRDGYDGEISLLFSRTGEDTALAIKAMLESVGFTVSFDVGRTILDVIRKYRVENDYDLALTGANVFDSSIYPTLYEEVVATSNAVGYQNPKMTTLLKQLRAATSYEAKLAVVADIQRLWADTVPFIVLFAGTEYIAWQNDVHGVVPTLNTTMLFHDAWIGQS